MKISESPHDNEADIFTLVAHVQVDGAGPHNSDKADYTLLAKGNREER